MARVGPHAAPSGAARRGECAKAGGLCLWRRPLVKPRKRVDRFWVEPR